MTTEARDALAKALLVIEAPTVGTTEEQADAILAALDGWTLVPVDAVADAEALMHGLLVAVQTYDADGDVRDAVGLVRDWLDRISIPVTRS